MRLEIYDDGKPEAEQPVLLQLRKSSNGIDVVAVDTSGHMYSAGHLLRFTLEGRVLMHCSVNSELGFDLDFEASIKTK